jgi:hypothetical protein
MGSHFDFNNEVVIDAIINPNDQSGQNFVDNEIIVNSVIRLLNIPENSSEDKRTNQ